MSFTFKHPKYYTELRKRNKLDQAISGKNSTECKTRSPGPGLKHQAASAKHQATSKPEPSSGSQASSTKLLKLQAASLKPQAKRLKLQAASYKLPDSFSLIKFFVLVSGIKN